MFVVTAVLQVGLSLTASFATALFLQLWQQHFQQSALYTHRH